MADQYHATPLPHDEAAEAAILGAILWEPRRLALVRQHIPHPRTFYLERHQLVYRSYLKLADSGVQIDIRTVEAAVKDAGAYEKIGGIAFLAGLDLHLPDMGDVEAYCRIVLDRWAKRQIIEAVTMARADAFNGVSSPELISRIADTLAGIGSTVSVGGGGRGLDEALDDLSFSTAPDPGIPTGLADVDRIVGGWRPGQLVLLAAAPGMGKTSLMLQMARAAAGHGRVMVFSLEMTEQELLHRLVSQVSGIASRAIAGGDMTPGETDRALEAVRLLSGYRDRIWIDETPEYSVAQIEAAVALRQLREGCDIVFVDYLTTLKLESGYKMSDRLTATTLRLKAAAKRLHIPFVVLHHLSRQHIHDRRRPSQADLREGGERDADVCMFIWRPGDPGVSLEEKDWQRLGIEDENRETYAEILISKHRGGPTGKVKTVWLGERTTFADRERRRDAHTPF